MKRTEILRRPFVRSTLMMTALGSGALGSDAVPGRVGAAVWSQRYDGNVNGGFLRSDDGRVVVSAGDDGALWIWRDDLPGQQLRRPDPASVTAQISSLAISDDDQALLVRRWSPNNTLGPLEVLELASGQTTDHLPAKMPGQTETDYDEVLGFTNGRVYYKNNAFVSVYDTHLKKTVFLQQMQGRYLSNTDGCVKSDGTLVYDDDRFIHIVDPVTWKESASINLSLLMPGDDATYAYSCELQKNTLYVKLHLYLTNAKGYLDAYNRTFIYNYHDQAIVPGLSNNLYNREEERSYIHLFQGYGLASYPQQDASCPAHAQNEVGVFPEGVINAASRLVRLRDGALLSKLCRSVETDYLNHSMLPVRLWVRQGTLEYSNDDEDTLYDFQSGLVVRRYGDTPAQIVSSPCGTFDVLSFRSGMLLLKNAATGQDVMTLFNNSRSALRTDGTLSGLGWNATAGVLSMVSSQGLALWPVPQTLGDADCATSTAPVLSRVSLPDVTLLTPPSDHPGPNFAALPKAASVSPDGSHAAMGFMNGDVQLWDVRHKKLEARWHDEHASVLTLAWSPSGHVLAYANEKGRVWMHDLRTQAVTGSGTLAPTRDPQQDATHQPLWIRDLQWNPDGSRLAIAGGWGEVYVWQPHTPPARVLATRSAEQGFTALQWSDDGKTLVAGQRDGGMKVVDVHSGTVLQAWSAAHDAILSLTIHGDTVTTISRDKVLAQWRVRSLIRN
ncbi:hypothetical protein MF271_22310 (plasmid) [Deinococcus sp. KNUC1210]|uniref:WD40 repeat domain-containing protein n=1 Tax=Deinococcus sp. KNUC1210 TaxID=2917691 RepID=UPI001EF093AE|nr:hypothetical protein [Deinococcus sp. KNUC1210]ULH18206.1 hypothetical protein MF271_22310 [Deinococcus sp. KNUC1210]